MLTNLRKQLKLFNTRYYSLLKGKRSYIRAIGSFFYCAFRHQASAEDFFRYRFIEKSDYERNKFITYGRSKSIIHHFNASGRTELFNDKRKFNEFFSSMVKRHWLCTETSDKRQIVDFINTYDRVIAKPLNGGQGKGIFVISRKQGDDNIDYILKDVIGGGGIYLRK